MPPAFLGKLRSLFGAGDSLAAKKLIQREARFSVHGKLIYRPSGGMDWHKGFTENLSATGVLFRGDAPLPLNTPIEMSITPPKAPGQRIPEGIYCWGTIVRSAMDAGTSTSVRPIFGVRIDKFRNPPKFLSDADIKYERLA
jgi:hypothetical protein